MSRRAFQPILMLMCLGSGTVHAYCWHSAGVFVKGFMREVFEPMGDDAWEKIEW
ncbi:hypothetical protein [Pseudomonas azerbaijanoccidentalis]